MKTLDDNSPKAQAPKPEKPTGVKRIRKANGRTYDYHRKTMTPLPGEPGSDEYMAALEAAEASLASKPDLPDSFAVVAFSYLASPTFLALAPSSQALRRRVIDHLIEDGCGPEPVGERALDTSVVEAMTENMRLYTPGAARVWLSTFRALMQHAIKLRLRKTDPTKGIKRPKLRNPDGIATWSEEDIAAFRAYWHHGTMERLALELLLWTVQRRGDALRFGRQHVKALPKPVQIGPYTITHALQFRQQKTKAALTLPIFPELQAALDAMPPSNHLTFLTRDGEPFDPLEFTCWFIRAGRKAGLPPGRSPHGLRKAGCRRLAEAGCSANIIASWSGHRDWREIRRYTDAANQWGLALTGLEAVARTFAAEQNGTETFFGNRNGNHWKREA